MTHACNERYRALFDRTLQILCNAGIGETLAYELAKERTLTVALKSHAQAFLSFVSEQSDLRHLAEQRRQIRTMTLGQLLGHDPLLVRIRPIFRLHFVLLAEREEFEP
jgi:uncharacterized ubiquitin-like protein YukD